MHNFTGTLNHLLGNVLGAAKEYENAEEVLSRSQASGTWDREGNIAKRKAAELAIAIDGLADRAARESQTEIGVIRTSVSALCILPGSQELRLQSFERVRGIANAYKHNILDDRRHVIDSFDCVLAVGLGYGLDGYGVGKCGGVEVIITDKSGESWKFLGDAPAVVSAWFHFLQNNGVMIPTVPIIVCGVQVYP
jgi:hypothetical protein